MTAGRGATTIMTEDPDETAKRTSEASSSSAGELREFEKLKSTFLATVSHELRSPLTSIIGYTEMLQSGAVGALSGGQAEILETIHEKADELLGLIGSLLDLGRLEAKTLELQPEGVDPRALLSGVVSTIVPAANRRNIVLDVQVSPDTPKIWGDPVRLRQIVLNLADNAIKFTQEGGLVSLEATTSPGRGTEQSDGVTRGSVVLRVRDSGKGIAEDELARIFDVFYQVDGGTTRTHGGAGLGLSIVRQLVDAHDGAIEVHSKPGEGTSFTITLPAVPADA